MTDSLLGDSQLGGCLTHSLDGGTIISKSEAGAQVPADLKKGADE